MTRRKPEDKDAAERARYRDDPVAFVKEVLGFKPLKWQVEALESTSPTLCLLCGRNSGKTMVALVSAAHFLLTRRKAVLCWISAHAETSRYARSEFRSLLFQAGLGGLITEDSSSELRLKSGSVLYWFPNSPAMIRGRHATWSRAQKKRELRLYVDESQLVLVETWSAALPVAMSGSDTKVWYMGTALSEDSWYARQAKEGMAGSETVQTIVVSSTEVAKERPQQFSDFRLEEFKASVDPATYDAEINGVFSPALAAYFSSEMIADATRQYSGPIFTGDAGKDYQFALGVDLAPSAEIGTAHNAFVVVCRRVPSSVLVRQKDELEERRYTGGPTMMVVTGSTMSEREANRRKILESLPPAPTTMEDGLPNFCVAHIVRTLTVDSYSLYAIVSELLELYPSLVMGRAETFEGLVWGSIACHVRHTTEFGDERTTRGRGHLRLRMSLFHPSNSTKNAAYGATHRLMREGLIAIPGEGPEAKQLRAELMHLRKTITPSGNVRIAAEEKFKRDDVCDALSFAVHELEAGRLQYDGSKQASIGRRA